MADPFRSLTRHQTYYIPSADLSFLLGHVQFRVHRYFFERESAFFRGKLTMPMSPGSTRQGASDADPLVLEDIRPEDFERFLWVFYNPRYSLYDAKVDDWSVILTLSHRWGFAEVKALAVRELEKKEFSSIDRIVFYQTCEVDRNLLIPHFAAICARESPLTLAEGLKLGMETTLVIASAREYIRAIPHPNGLRSPTTPTVEGEELYDMIRELFNIPRVRKADPAPTKDDAKPSTSISSSAADFHPPTETGETSSTPTNLKSTAAERKALRREKMRLAKLKKEQEEMEALNVPTPPPHSESEPRNPASEPAVEVKVEEAKAKEEPEVQQEVTLEPEVQQEVKDVEVPKVEEVKEVEAPKVDEVKAEEPQAQEINVTKPEVEETTVEAEKAEEVNAEVSVPEEPKVEEVKAEEPTVDEAKVEVTEEAKEPVVEPPKVEITAATTEEVSEPVKEPEAEKEVPKLEAEPATAAQEALKVETQEQPEESRLEKKKKKKKAKKAAKEAEEASTPIVETPKEPEPKPAEVAPVHVEQPPRPESVASVYEDAQAHPSEAPPTREQTPADDNENWSEAREGLTDAENGPGFETPKVAPLELPGVEEPVVVAETPWYRVPHRHLQDVCL
ncbi:hypothetical protein DFP72DRAFT_292661 [Ephemerocybe angulata]|uniref:BTB domain-containing protein n=1 Tax=Ephemerocybe angulata TaxID=980116 RepID=A0A8H6H879_9AGAR|nr:hypothetical protein DFP72DRAFT_292661 [Tulosesus angulatus]